MATLLNTSSLYEQLYLALRDLVLSDAYQPGDKFLTERAICEQYGVSRSTSNKALSNLISAGYLEIRKGVGTFVKAKPVTDNFFTMSKLVADASARGVVFRTKFLAVTQLTGKDLPPNIRQELQVEDAEPIFLAEFLRYVHENIPFLHEYRYIVSRYCPGLTIYNYQDFFSGKFVIDIAYYEEKFLHGVYNKREAELLETPEGTAYSIVESIGYNDQHIPIWWGECHHRQDESLYSVRFNVSCKPGEANDSHIYFDFHH